MEAVPLGEVVEVFEAQHELGEGRAGQLGGGWLLLHQDLPGMF